MKYLKSILTTVKLFPEFVVIPLIAISYYFAQKLILTLDPTAADFSIDWIIPLIMGLVAVTLANAMAHGAIKYNQPPIWKQYTEWLEGKRTLPKAYVVVWSIYFIGVLLAISIFI